MNRIWLALSRIFALALLAGFAAAAAPSAARAQGHHALFTRDGIDVWAVGSGGVAWRSFDGGATWTSLTVGVDHLRGVSARGHTVLLVGDNGVLHRSTDSGGNWSTTIASGAPHLRAIQMVDDLNGWVVGGGGTILVTTDGGQNWSPQASGTASRLNAVKFLDQSTGWAAGAGGTILATTNGGATWTPQASGTTKELYALDATLVGTVTPVVWAVGRDATARRSLDGGASFGGIDLKIDSRSDVNGVWLQSATHVTLVGGGGFIRVSTNGGTDWTFRRHTMQGEMTGIFYQGAGNAWACNRSNRVVLRSTDGGVAWIQPAAATVGRSFALKQSIVSGTVRGSTFAQHPTNKETFYAVLGSKLYKSQNRGDNWTEIAAIPSVNKTNAFYVSPLDSTLMVAAAGTPDRIVRSVDGGASWATTLTRDFTEYGVPLELDPNDPARLIFAPEDGKIYESLDFGATWDTLSSPGFRSPCDIQIMPDSSKIVWVGDGVTSIGQGQMFVSVDGGESFSLNYNSTGSEVPMIAATRLDRGVGFATHWGVGGVRRTEDHGASWPQVTTTGSAWGVDIAKDDPNAMGFGVYAGNLFYLSLDQGTTYTTVPISSSNYSIYMPDRNTVLAEQGVGLYKMTSTFSYTPVTSQSLLVVAPNGGETWYPGEERTVSYSGTNVALARIEYRSAPGQPWQLLGVQEGYAGAFSWTVPDDATSQARIRVVDAFDAAPADSSDAFFTIAAPRVELLTAGLDFGTRTVGSSTLLPVSLRSSGTAPLQVTSVTTSLGAYVPGRTAFTIAAADSDTVGVTFTPPSPGSLPDTLVIVTNAPGGPLRVPLAGVGQALAPQLAGLPDTLQFGVVEVGASACDTITIQNDGNALLSITNVFSSDSRFTPSRTTLSIAPAASDTLVVCYEPTTAGPDLATLTLSSNDPNSPHEFVMAGEAHQTVGVPDGAPRPAIFTLRQNRPNPFTGRTRIEYTLGERVPVSLEIYSPDGRRVAVLVRGEQDPGRYEVEFGSGAATADGGRIGTLASGVYFYRLTAGSWTRTQRMLLVR